MGRKRPAYGTNIPAARDVLAGVADKIDFVPGCHVLAEEIRRTIRDLMTRSYKNRSAPQENAALTRDQVRDIKILLRTTNLSQMKIANHVGTNPGRVSEVLHGLRDDNGRIK